VLSTVSPLRSGSRRSYGHQWLRLLGIEREVSAKVMEYALLWNCIYKHLWLHITVILYC